MTRWLGALLVLGCISLAAQAPSSVNLHVREAGGIRRTQFPVSARVPFPRGALKDAASVTLLLNQTEIPVQAAVESRWPDGSVQWLSVDLNATIGPAESQTYTLQYGDGVVAHAAARGLTAVETADAIQAGNIRLDKSGSPLIASVKYRDETIAPGANGLIVTDTAGATHDLTTADGLKVEILKRGPLSVVLRYSGSIKIDAGSTAPFVLTVEMPNSKSWVRISASVSDPNRRVREIALHTPLALGAQPWVWDFGTTRWTYGALRNPSDSVVMHHTAVGDWIVSTGPKGRLQPYETSSTDHATFGGWGHVQGAKEVVAFAIEGMSTRPGTYDVAIDGEGQTSFRFAAAAPQAQHELTVYEHFVSTPVQIGAATSPAAILSPLVAVCDREQYRKSGVPVPANVP
jgi:hypothetical protein